jgi:hypothetical protein
MRVVLIEGNNYRVFDNRVCLAHYILEDDAEKPTVKEIEWLRVQDYPSKA